MGFFSDVGLVGRRFFLPGFEDHRDAWVFLKSGLMGAEEIPVEVVEGAGVGPGFDLGFETAFGAVIAHFRNVTGTGGVGFGGEESAIGIEDHAKDVGLHDPIVGVDVEFHIPLKNGGRVKSSKEKEIAEHHQSLDVMIVADGHGLLDGLAKAIHFGFARVDPGGEGAFGVEGVEIAVSRHFQPIDAIDEFAPADDLPDKTFNGGERGGSGSIGFLSGLDAFHGSQQSDVEEWGKNGMEEGGLTLCHHIFEGAKRGQPFFDKGVQPDEGATAGDGEPEIFGGSGVIGKVGPDCRHDFAGYFVASFRREAGRGNVGFLEIAKGCPIVGVEVPRSSFGLTFGIQEEVEPGPLLPVVVLHQKMLFAFGPFGEGIACEHELAVGQGFDGDAEFARKFGEGLGHFPFVGFHDPDAIRSVLGEKRFEG